MSTGKFARGGAVETELVACQAGPVKKILKKFSKR
jgi:hypothetical protein